MDAKLLPGDCIEVMRGLDAGSIDAIITDPPYGLEFMGKDWDAWDRRDHVKESARNEGVGKFLGAGKNLKEYRAGHSFQVWCKKWAKEALRVLKPGGFMFAMGGTRTHHRLTCGIEDAGFMIKDEICWVYCSGFPKAQDLAMMIERKLGGEGEDAGAYTKCRSAGGNSALPTLGAPPVNININIKIPTLPEAKAWTGWKTPALKPAFEPIVVAQKPVEGTITENVMRHGVGGFNIDGCRVPYKDEDDAAQVDFNRRGTAERSPKKEGDALGVHEGGWAVRKSVGDLPSGRFPPNLIMSEPCLGEYSKFFIIPKAGQGEKNEGTDKNIHPTVKPVLLMQHLIKLCTKDGAVVLDPFMGSGTTGVAALNICRNFIGIEQSEEYMKIAEARIRLETQQSRLGDYVEGMG